MWSEIQNNGMMGAGGKRKLCGGTNGGGAAKAARWEESSLARLQAVAVPGEGGWADERAAAADCGCWRGARAWPQETIRCAENGKSYLELGGSWPRRRCCARQCHRERRLKVMNLCVFKLARFRQSADPSLRRSVLVCNTLRRMEREAEREAAEEAARGGGGGGGPGQPREPLAPLPPLAAAGRATPFPAAGPDGDSGYGEEEGARPIDWGSVLSLGSQSALDPLNNNEPCAAWDAADAAWGPPPPDERPDADLDGFVHILVGSS